MRREVFFFRLCLFRTAERTLFSRTSVFRIKKKTSPILQAPFATLLT